MSSLSPHPHPRRSPTAPFDRTGRPSRVQRRALGAATAALGLAALAGCSGTTAGDGTTDDDTLTVFAAASLSGAFEEIGTAFEAAHAPARVEFSYAGSSDLVSQIEAGAPADVLATADERTMATLAEASLTAAEPVAFATNTLRIVTAPGNPLGIAGLPDLTGEDVSTVVCAPQVPCGAATEIVLSEAGVDLRPVSEEHSVTDVLGKVTSGEADAGLVYVTDALSAGEKVAVVEFPESASAVNVYPISPVAGPDSYASEAGDSGALADAFIEFVTGPEGQEVLADHGFEQP